MALAEPGEFAAPELSPEAAAKLQKLDGKLGLTLCLILSVSDNGYGYGKRTDVDAYRLQSRGSKGVINMKTSSKIGRSSPASTSSTTPLIATHHPNNTKGAD